MPTLRRRIDLHWQLARHQSAGESPVDWVPAVVPGAVQLDWARAHHVPDYRVGRNVEQWDGWENDHWTYRTQLGALPAKSGDRRLFLVLEGVDYAADVFIDGVRRAGIEGVQTGLRLDATDWLHAGSEIRVRIHPAPKSHPEPRDRTQANRSCKPAVSYEWDFHPRLIPLGLWRPAYLESRPGVHFVVPPEVRYRLSDDLRQATGRVEIALAAPAPAGTQVRWQLLAPGGGQAARAEVAVATGAREVSVPFTLADAELWWPHDQGRPALYRSITELADATGGVVDAAESRVGFRRVQLVMARNQWKHPTDFPKSRSRPPITFEVNGRSLFVKGTNWVCPDVFPGAVTRERYAEQLALVRSANLSLVRMWGGATAPQDDFYELCDELGLLVWQEFPLACNRYPDSADYLDVLGRESRTLITRLRSHASVVLWCGGNELFNFWSGMTDQSLPVRLLNRNCYELDPDRPFIPTAPLEGMGHGHYLFRDPATGEECWSMFQRAHCTAYSEFGCPATPSEDALHRMIPAGELWPPRPGTSWQVHHAFGVWLPGSHLYLEAIEYYFGPPASLEQLVEWSQLLQCAGLQGLFEEARRQKPVASLALNWCFNEPWPCAANNSLVAWPCEPKPALAVVGSACRRTLASARVPRFSWHPGEEFEAELWLLHDGPEAREAVTVSAVLETGSRRIPLGEWTTMAIPPNENLAGPKLRVRLPESLDERFSLLLEVAGRPEWNSRYTLVRARAGRIEGGRPIEVRPGTTNF